MHPQVLTRLARELCVPLRHVTCSPSDISLRSGLAMALTLPYGIFVSTGLKHTCGVRPASSTPATAVRTCREASGPTTGRHLELTERRDGRGQQTYRQKRSLEAEPSPVGQSGRPADLRAGEERLATGSH